MGRAQGELRGQLTKTEEPEAQYGGGEQGAGATPEIARRTIAAKQYRDSVAHLNLHERWERDEATGTWQLVGYTSAVVSKEWLGVGQTAALKQARHAALGY